MKIKSVSDRKQLIKVGKEKPWFHRSMIVDATLFGENALPAHCFKDNSCVSIFLASNLLELILPQAFDHCTNLTRLDAACGTIGEEAFTHCDNLQDFNFETVIYIGQGAFENSGIKKANLRLCKVIPKNTFKDCFSLKEVNLNNIETIGEQAFLNCNIERLIFGENLASIDSNAFTGNPLKTVIFTAIKPPVMETSAFDKTCIQQVILDKNCDKELYYKNLPKGWSEKVKELSTIQIKDILSF